MTDFLLLEKIHKMIKELSKPRIMFRKGISADGFFRPYMSFSEYTQAKLFSSYDEITPVKVRFASMLGDKGTADTVRNIKGMNVKFVSAEGEYDMICHSLPVFFINSEDKFFDIKEAFTRREMFDGVNTDAFWRFLTENPESVNCAVRLFSQEGLSASYIDMKWFSVNSDVWENSTGEKCLVRYKWVPAADKIHKSEGKKRMDRISAEFMAGFDADKALREMESAIEDGRFPEYELYIQMADYDSVSESEYLSRTLMWDEEKHPYAAAGVMKLTEIPQDRRKNCDLLSFAPGNTVRGIDICRDGFADIMNYICRLENAERGE